MVHNGIEYGMMAALAEGLERPAKANIGTRKQASIDAENGPAGHPEHYQYDLDMPEITEVWRRGSVIGSWLLDLTAHRPPRVPEPLELRGPRLGLRRGPLDDKGRHRRRRCRRFVLTAALYERFSSRGEADFADKVLSAMRKEFGGHQEKPS